MPAEVTPLERCRAQQRGSRAVCQGMHKGHEGDHNFVLPEGAPPPKPLAKRVDERTLRVARMLSVLLDEDQDSVQNPHPVRIEQARDLNSEWSSIGIIGPLHQLIRLKIGYCVTCPEHPCPVCGYDGSRIV
jgi:hypothetical protein